MELSGVSPRWRGRPCDDDNEPQKEGLGVPSSSPFVVTEALADFGGFPLPCGFDAYKAFVSYEHAPDLHDIKPEERVAFVEGFRYCFWRGVLFALLAVLTGGLALLVGHWLQLRRFYLLHCRCPLGKATHFLVQTQSGSFQVVKAQRVPFDLRALTASPGSNCRKPGLDEDSVSSRQATSAALEAGGATSLTRSSSCSSSRSSDAVGDGSGSSPAEPERPTSPPFADSPWNRPNFAETDARGPEKESEAGSLLFLRRKVFAELDEAEDALGRGEFHPQGAFCCVCKGEAGGAAACEEESLVFEFMSIRYYLRRNSPERCFSPLTFDVGMAAAELVHAFALHAPCASLRERRRRLFGDCTLRVPCPSVLELLLEEVLEPFYVFQLFAIGLWLLDEYVQYAAAICLITAISTFSDVSTRRRNVRRLQRAARLNTPVEVLRRQCCAMECLCSDREAHRTGCEAAHRQTDSDRERERERGDVSPQQSLRRSRPLCTRRECLAVQSIHSEELVNGDLLVLKPDMRLPCDVLLLRGCAVVDECNLTGESFPVRKSALPVSQASRKKLVVEQVAIQEARHMLFAGSRVVSVGAGAFSEEDSASLPPALVEAEAVGGVFRVGFATSQGQTLRPLLFPSQTRLRFDTESLRFLCVLAGLTVFAAVYALVICIRQGMSPYKTFLRVFDLFTDAVPPALRAALSVALTAATSRLFSVYGIVCSAPSRINVCGYVRCLCVDKTGTLTEEGVALQACIPSCHCKTSSAFSSEAKNPQRRLTFARSLQPRSTPTGNGKGGHALFEAPELPSSDFCFDASVQWKPCDSPECLLCLRDCETADTRSGQEGCRDSPTGESVGSGGFVSVPSRCVPGQPAPCVCRMHLFRCLSSCSSLVAVDEGGTGAPGGGRVAGDPLEVEMLAVSGWTLVGSWRNQHPHAAIAGGASGEEGSKALVSNKESLYARLAEQTQAVAAHAVGDLTFLLPPTARLGSERGFSTAGVLCVIRRFDFCAVLQRMSVVALEVETGDAFVRPSLSLPEFPTRCQDTPQRTPLPDWRTRLQVYCKGSPESIFQLCIPSSIPPDAEQKVQSLAAGGLRVLATAARRLSAREAGKGCSSVKTLSRRRAERDLCLLGLMVFHNELKADAVSTVSALRRARVDVRILTGDSAYTTVSVAEQCGLLDAKADAAARCPTASLKPLPECACLRGHSSRETTVDPSETQRASTGDSKGSEARSEKATTRASSSLRKALKAADLQNSRVVILGDVYARHEEHVGRREYLVWSLLLRPKYSSPPLEGGRTPTTSLRRREVSTYVDLFSGSASAAMALRASRRAAAAQSPRLQHFPSLDLRELLAALPDARLPILVLTGRAFRHLRRLNALLKLPFAERCDALVDDILSRRKEALRQALEEAGSKKTEPLPSCLLSGISLSGGDAFGGGTSQVSLWRSSAAPTESSREDGFCSTGAEKEMRVFDKRDWRSGERRVKVGEDEASGFAKGANGGLLQGECERRPATNKDSQNERVRQVVETLMFASPNAALPFLAERQPPLSGVEVAGSALATLAAGEGGVSLGAATSASTGASMGVFSSAAQSGRPSLLVPGLRKASDEVSGGGPSESAASASEEAVLLQREAVAALHRRLDALAVGGLAGAASSAAGSSVAFSAAGGAPPECAVSASLSRVDQIHKVLQLAEHQRAEAESIIALSDEAAAAGLEAASSLFANGIPSMETKNVGLRGQLATAPPAASAGLALQGTTAPSLRAEGFSPPSAESPSSRSRGTDALSDASCGSPSSGREGRLAFVKNFKRAALKAAKKALPSATASEFASSPTSDGATDGGALEALQAPLLSEDCMQPHSFSPEDAQPAVAEKNPDFLSPSNRSRSSAEAEAASAVHAERKSGNCQPPKSAAKGESQKAPSPNRDRSEEAAAAQADGPAVGLELLTVLQHGEGVKALDGMTILFRSRTCRCCGGDEFTASNNNGRAEQSRSRPPLVYSQELSPLRLGKALSPGPPPALEPGKSREERNLSATRGDAWSLEKSGCRCVAAESCFRMSLYEFALRQTALLCRASPQDKGDFVAALQELPADPFVGMAGDGTNDLVAIKRADLGISIAELGGSEQRLAPLGMGALKAVARKSFGEEKKFVSPGASLASSFTVRCLDSCVSLLREGRCVLQNSIALVLFITLYSVIELGSVLTMYTAGKNLTDAQYMWVDLVTILPLSLGLSQAEAPSSLSTEVPPKSLFAKPILTSVLGQAVLQLFFQVAAYAAFLRTPREALQTSSPEPKGHHLSGSDNTAVFLVSSLQYLYVCAAVGSSGRQWKKGVVTNWRCCLYMCVLGLLALCFLLFPPESQQASVGHLMKDLGSHATPLVLQLVSELWRFCARLYTALYKWLGLVALPTSLRWQLCALSLFNFAATLAFETGLVQPLLQAHVKRAEKDGGGTSILKKSREACSVAVVWPA